MMMMNDDCATHYVHFLSVFVSMCLSNEYFCFGYFALIRKTTQQFSHLFFIIIISYNFYYLPFCNSIFYNCWDKCCWDYYYYYCYYLCYLVFNLNLILFILFNWQYRFCLFCFFYFKWIHITSKINLHLTIQPELSQTKHPKAYKQYGSSLTAYVHTHLCIFTYVYNYILLMHIHT